MLKMYCNVFLFISWSFLLQLLLCSWHRDTSDFFRSSFNVSFAFPLLFFFFFLFPLGVFITSFYELCGQCPRFSSKRHVCMSLSRHSFEGSELLSNKTCIIGKTCSTNLPLLQIHNCLIDRNSSFSWSFLNYPLRIFCLQARTWALNVSYFTVIHATLKSLGCSSDFFFQFSFLRIRDWHKTRFLLTSVDTWIFSLCRHIFSDLYTSQKLVMKYNMDSISLVCWRKLLSG